jgi:hypothetical protein
MVVYNQSSSYAGVIGRTVRRGKDQENLSEK